MNNLTSRALQEFQDAAAGLVNPALQEWKDRGGKVIGCMYHFVPEEIMTAAGLMPFRMRATGSSGTELSESCFTQVNCSFVRHLFDSAMRGHQGFLDGVVTVNNCDHIRRLFDNWESKIKTPYRHFLWFPKKSGTEQVEAYRSELAEMAGTLEYMVLEALVESDGYALLAMGRTDSLGCFCSVNDLLRDAFGFSRRSSTRSSLTAKQGWNRSTGRS
ncbi:2-hydroxyacyl-CoA dehydratase family protein [Geobacter argillaceus]|uniref:2-hydroxyglutaryl-CoA dehydratase D-component n=1 Tax=Geobacter argillaceus TaxID=345631 RepID=A0A562V5W5_9BACT|nr:2-hydroxyacyl-CoA dehydratase family protein [Geobacter argillaceus]TWJ13289.1 2-hydroxyglutaryl-CoA dehydratase D-component [Geobacter argillaceus]